MKLNYLCVFSVCFALACGDDTDPELVLIAGSSSDVKADVTEADGGTGTGSDTGSDTGSSTGRSKDVEQSPDDVATEDGGTSDKPDVVVSPSSPRVLSLSVSSGPAEGGTATVIVTAGFATDFRVELPEIRFGGELATDLTALSRGVVQVLTPKGGADQTVDVTVKGEKNNGVLEKAYTYFAEAPVNYVLVKVEGVVGPSGSPAVAPVTIELVGDVKPAAVLVNVKVDLLELPVVAPNPIPGDVHTASDKDLLVSPDKFDTVRIIVLGKNRNLLNSGTIAKLGYSVPPTEPWSITPLAVSAQAVDPLGTPIKVITHSGWVGVAPKNEATP